LHFQAREFTVGTVAKEVIDAKQDECERRRGPHVNQKQNKVLQVGRTNAIVHPGTMMVHSTDTSIADPTMMRTVRFVSLAPATKGVKLDIVRVNGNCRRGNRAGVGKCRLCV
jgi:hypothetical protein